MKISLKNKDALDNNLFSLRKLAKSGIAFGLLIGIGLTQVSSDNNDLDSMMQPTVLEVSCDDINDMNIIINDNDCSDTFFNEVCDNLKNDGLVFTTSNKNDGINVDNSVVVTLDQQYSSGSNTLIFAPYDNTRLGYSDSLTLAMQSAFLQNGFLIDGLSQGKLGFRDDGNGNVTTTIPTETEEDIDSNYDTSFVTVSFGTTNVNAEWVAKSIENGLARQKYYLDHYDSNTDLLYRANAGEEVSVVAQYFNSNAHDLSNYNNVGSNESLDQQVVVNPGVSNMTVFDKDTQLEIDSVKTRAY